MPEQRYRTALAKKFCRLASRGNSTRLKEKYFFTNCRRFHGIVRHEEHWNAELPMKRLQLLQNGIFLFGVQRSQWFVKEQQLRRGK